MWKVESGIKGRSAPNIICSAGHHNAARARSFTGVSLLHACEASPSRTQSVSFTFLSFHFVPAGNTSRLQSALLGKWNMESGEWSCGIIMERSVHKTTSPHPIGGTEYCIAEFGERGEWCLDEAQQLIQSNRRRRVVQMRGSTKNRAGAGKI